LALDLGFPGNGYAYDSLYGIQLINTGTFNEDDEYLTLKLWADITGNGFTMDDSILSQFSFNSGTWNVEDLSYPINYSGARFLVTVDIIDSQFDGGTLQLEVPLEGIEYRSGTTGPDDIVVSNPVSGLHRC